MAFAGEEAFQNVFNMLGEEYAEMNNLPDSEFSDAYMAFRSRVEEAICHSIRPALAGPVQLTVAWPVNNCPTVSVGYVDSYMSPLKAIGKLLVGGVLWINKFFLSEGIQPLLRDPNTFSLDPAPFKHMIDTIMEKSTRVDFSNVYTDQQFTTSAEKFKTFAKSIIDSISAHGPTQAIVQRQFYDIVAIIIDSIKETSVSQEVHREIKQYSVEVKKGSGTVVLGSYVSSFDGVVSTYCFFQSQVVTMKVAVKVWKFATVRQLKEEFERLISQ